MNSSDPVQVLGQLPLHIFGYDVLECVIHGNDAQNVPSLLTTGMARKSYLDITSATSLSENVGSTVIRSVVMMSLTLYLGLGEHEIAQGDDAYKVVLLVEHINIIDHVDVVAFHAKALEHVRHRASR